MTSERAVKNKSKKSSSPGMLCTLSTMLLDFIYFLMMGEKDKLLDRRQVELKSNEGYSGNQCTLSIQS